MKRRTKNIASVVYPHCAGIDIAKDEHAVALPADGHGEQEVRMFGGFTGDLESMASWLSEHGIEQVALESTGVYWIAVYEVLDGAGFDVWLVNPAGLARPDRRKSDVLDCQWIQQLMSLGMLKRSHRPPDRICELRSHVRNRRRAVADRARGVQHMQKALQQMNLKLDTVLSDIAGKTGMAIIAAIVGGERDGRRLAGLRDGRVKADEGTIAAALQGNWREEHLFALEQALDTYHHHERQIVQLEERIAQLVRRLSAYPQQPDDGDDELRRLPKAGGRHWKSEMNGLMGEMFGTNLMKVPGVGFETVLTLLSEVGPDFSMFPTVRHFGQWLGLAPGTNISGGKRLSGGKSRGTQVTGQALRMSAMTLRRNSSLLGDAHRSRCLRMDPPRAIKATAHQLARILYSLVVNKSEYSEKPLHEANQKRQNRKVRNLIRQAERFGFHVVGQGGEVIQPNQAVSS